MKELVGKAAAAAGVVVEKIVGIEAVVLAVVEIEAVAGAVALVVVEIEAVAESQAVFDQKSAVAWELVVVPLVVGETVALWVVVVGQIDFAELVLVTKIWAAAVATWVVVLGFVGN